MEKKKDKHYEAQPSEDTISKDRESLRTNSVTRTKRAGGGVKGRSEISTILFRTSRGNQTTERGTKKL